MQDAGYEFDICFTSVQKRAIRTLWTVLDAIDQMWLPVVRTWRLNERHYGGLTGLNKAETAAKHGEAQVKIWRRSYDVPPPPMEPDHPFYSNISKVWSNPAVVTQSASGGVRAWTSLIFIFQIYVVGCFSCVFLCALHVCRVPCQKKTSVLPTGARDGCEPHMSPENQTKSQKSNKCPELSHLSRPRTSFVGLPNIINLIIYDKIITILSLC